VAVAGTAVSPSAPIPDNCKQIVILNRGPVDALFGIAAPGVGALTEGTNAARLPVNGSISLGIGTIMERGSMDPATVAGSGLVYDGVAGTPTLDVTYVSVLGAL
jgi:hypothetical protein